MDIEYIILEKLDSRSNKSVIAFCNSVLNHNVDNNVWDWEFNTIADTVFTLAKDGDVIAGTQSMLPVYICVSDKIVSSAKSETSYLSSDYRGKKIFEKLYALAVDKTVKNGSEVIWGFTPAVKAWKKNLGFQVYEKSMSTIYLHKSPYKLLKTIKSSRNLFYGIGKFVVYNTFFVRTFLRAKSALKNSQTLEALPALKKGSDINALLKKLLQVNEKLIYIKMDEAYVGWRVHSNPARKYKQVYFYKNHELAGYLIYSIDRERLNIADICYGTDESVLKYIVKHVLSIHRECTSLSYWGNKECFVSKSIFELIEKMGGKIVQDADRNFVFQKYNQSISPEQLEDLKNWHINGLWTEGFHI